MDRGGNGGTPSPQGHALLLGMPDGYFQHQLWGDLEEFRVVAVGLEQERQHIEAASWGFPALLYTDLQTETFSHMSAPAPPNIAHSGHKGGKGGGGGGRAEVFMQALRGLSVMSGASK